MLQLDAIVVGGSFAGLSAAMQIARGRRHVAVIDAGKPRNRFAEHSHGFFAQDGVAPFEIVREGRAKLLAYPNVRFIDGHAVSAAGADGAFTVALASGETLQAPKLVLAIGVEDELPDITGVAERWGRTVLHCPYCHGYEFEGGPLAVLSVAPGSVHQAMLISEWGPVTYLLNGGPDPDAETLAKLTRRGVAIAAAQVRQISSTDEFEQIHLVDGNIIPVKALYLASRTRMASPLAEQIGCAFDDGPFGPIIRTDAAKLTSVPGVYAAGDAARAPHNATWASADGVTAGVSLHQALVFGSRE